MYKKKYYANILYYKINNNLFGDLYNNRSADNTIAMVRAKEKEREKSVIMNNMVY